MTKERVSVTYSPRLSQFTVGEMRAILSLLRKMDKDSFRKNYTYQLPKGVQLAEFCMLHCQNGQKSRTNKNRGKAKQNGFTKNGKGRVFRCPTSVVWASDCEESVSL